MRIWIYSDLGETVDPAHLTPWMCPTCRRVYWIEAGDKLDGWFPSLLEKALRRRGDHNAQACCERAWEADEGFGREQNPLMAWAQRVAGAAYAAGKRDGVDQGSGGA